MRWTPYAFPAAPTDDSHQTHTTQQRLLVTLDGRTYRLFRALPRREALSSGYPVLYLLDGNAAFEGLTPALLRKVPELLVVGVGYDTDQGFAVADRWLDYTPPLGADGPVPDPQRPERMAGGADRFLSRLIGPVREAAEQGVAVDSSRRDLWGHSFGGLFVLYTLFMAPEAFRGFCPVSPSLWWGGDIMERLEAMAAAPPTPPAHVLIMMGDREVRSGQPPPETPGPAPATLAMIDRLRVRQDLCVTARVLEGMGHRAALFASLPHALRAFSDCSDGGHAAS
ncbi:alpha/beta hydrolase [Roseospira visakhapatnamensis]|uniref:Alpha/beta hydrolase n=1 Tax=Roseospira visakhapatnamensis TaxID=390880 RepID=A0A7W6RG86_9PROT|nr:alpha/beta hydrolase-fold protein [Roseospira visakhapatnamensis]MBB4267765.1 hypothetical protein [Roseospira visakhapatnamensis]